MLGKMYFYFLCLLNAVFTAGFIFLTGSHPYYNPRALEGSEIHPLPFLLAALILLHLLLLLPAVTLTLLKKTYTRREKNRRLLFIGGAYAYLIPVWVLIPLLLTGIDRFYLHGIEARTLATEKEMAELGGQIKLTGYKETPADGGMEVAFTLHYPPVPNEQVHLLNWVYRYTIGKEYLAARNMTGCADIQVAIYPEGHILRLNASGKSEVRARLLVKFPISASCQKGAFLTEIGPEDVMMEKPILTYRRTYEHAYYPLESVYLILNPIYARKTQKQSGTRYSWNIVVDNGRDPLEGMKAAVYDIPTITRLIKGAASAAPEPK